jgi:hypothetical protein
MPMIRPLKVYVDSVFISDFEIPFVLSCCGYDIIKVAVYCELYCPIECAYDLSSCLLSSIRRLCDAAFKSSG